MSTFSWDSANWGRPGFNVHLADNGSDIPDAHSEGVDD